MSEPFPPLLTIAHRLPDRIRLRWHGGGDPPPETLAQLKAMPGVRDVEYRRASRSIVVRHKPDDAFAKPSPCAGRSTQRPPALRVTTPARPHARWLKGDRERPVRVLEDLLSLGLVGAWVLDLAMGGAGGAVVPVLVALLSALAVYRVWERRRPGGGLDADDLIVLRAA